MKKRGKEHVGIGSESREQELKSIKQDGGIQYRRVPQPSFPRDYPTTLTYLPACLTAYLPTCLTYLPTYQPTNLSVYLPNNPPTYQPTYPFMRLVTSLTYQSLVINVWYSNINTKLVTSYVDVCILYTDALHTGYSVNGHNETGRALLASYTTETLIHMCIYIYIRIQQQ